MARTTIKGNKALAKALGVHPVTICKWRRRGLLAKATLVDFNRTILYDLEKVYECLNHRPVSPGRKASYGS